MKKGTDYKQGENLIGKKIRVKVICTKNGKSCKGELYTIRMVSWGNPDYFYVEEDSKLFFTPSQIEFAPMDIKTLEELCETQELILKETKEKINNYKLRIKFMKENKLKEFSDDEFKVYAVLEQLEKGASKLEQAKIIAKLINS